MIPTLHGGTDGTNDDGDVQLQRMLPLFCDLGPVSTCSLRGKLRCIPQSEVLPSRPLQGRHFRSCLDSGPPEHPSASRRPCHSTRSLGIMPRHRQREHLEGCLQEDYGSWRKVSLSVARLVRETYLASKLACMFTDATVE